MMSEIYHRGPIVCSISTPEDFTYGYRGGLYNDPKNYTYESIDHNVEVCCHSCKARSRAGSLAVDQTYMIWHPVYSCEQLHMTVKKAVIYGGHRAACSACLQHGASLCKCIWCRSLAGERSMASPTGLSETPGAPIGASLAFSSEALSPSSLLFLYTCTSFYN